MAGSRLTHHGTIFKRVTGLLESGGMKETPLWYNVWKKYPPPLEPYSDRPLPPQDPIQEIVYEEDFERAKNNLSQHPKDKTKSRETNPKTNRQLRRNAEFSRIIG